MAENKKSFIFYSSWRNIFKELPKDKGYDLLMHILAYVNDEDPQTEDILVKAVFAGIKEQLTSDLHKWKIQQEQRIIAAKSSAASRQRASTSVERNETSVDGCSNSSTVNVDVDVDVDVNDNVSPNGDGLKPKKKKYSEPKIPTIGQVIDYFAENGYPESLAKYVFGYYEKIRDGKGSVWKDTNGNTVKDWKAKMRVVWFTDENKAKFEKQDSGQPKKMSEEEYRNYLRRLHQ